MRSIARVISPRDAASSTTADTVSKDTWIRLSAGSGMRAAEDVEGVGVAEFIESAKRVWRAPSRLF
jgi:hypothetical protein